MTTESLVSPQATARFVVTLPPEPSRLGEALRKDVASSVTALTTTNDAFRHLAQRAVVRLVIMIPFIDWSGAEWATQLFDLACAPERILIVRGISQLDSCGPHGQALRRVASRIVDYGGGPADETFHAKIVLADGVAAYVGSANLLRRSKEVNLECGVLVEGPAVQAIKVVVDAVLATFDTASPAV